MIITFEQAQKIAEEQIKPKQEHWRKSVPGDELVLHSTFEFDEGWLFYFQSRKFLQTRNNLDRPIGGGPVIVGKENGDFFLAGSGWTQEQLIDNFKEYLKSKHEQSS